MRIYLDGEIRRVECTGGGKVKREQRGWQADHPFDTTRFALFAGCRCRTLTITDVADETRLDWKTVKALVAQSKREPRCRAGIPASTVVGIDEGSIRKGHTCRIVVSGLVRWRPIWLGGKDRSEESMDGFYPWLGTTKS